MYVNNSIDIDIFLMNEHDKIKSISNNMVLLLFVIFKCL